MPAIQTPSSLSKKQKIGNLFPKKRRRRKILTEKILSKKKFKEAIKQAQKDKNLIDESVVATYLQDKVRRGDSPRMMFAKSDHGIVLVVRSHKLKREPHTSFLQIPESGFIRYFEAILIL